MVRPCLGEGGRLGRQPSQPSLLLSRTPAADLFLGVVPELGGAWLPDLQAAVLRRVQSSPGWLSPWAGPS